MINQLTKSIQLPASRRFLSTVAGFLLLATAAPSFSQVLPPSALPYGFSYEEWSAKWWRWNLGQSTNHMELVGDSGVSEGPASQVKFLAGAPDTTTETRCVRLPAHTPLFLSILSVWVDNTGCPTWTSFTADQLAVQAAGEWSAVSSVQCTIDGKVVADLNDPANTPYLTASVPFSYTTAEKGNVLAGIFGAPCIGGNTTVFPAVANGVYLMLAPLPPGKHTVHLVGVVGPAAAPFIKEDITYEITVTRQGGDENRQQDEK